MKKNITITILSIIVLAFLANGFIQKQEINQLRETIRNEIEGLPKMLSDMNDEYYENMVILNKNQCSQSVLDSIWNNAYYLNLFKKAKNTVEAHGNTP